MFGPRQQQHCQHCRLYSLPGKHFGVGYKPICSAVGLQRAPWLFSHVVEVDCSTTCYSPSDNALRCADSPAAFTHCSKAYVAIIEIVKYALFDTRRADLRPPCLWHCCFRALLRTIKATLGTSNTRVNPCFDVSLLPALPSMEAHPSVSTVPSNLGPGKSLCCPVHASLGKNDCMIDTSPSL